MTFCLPCWRSTVADDTPLLIILFTRKKLGPIGEYVFAIASSQGRSDSQVSYFGMVSSDLEGLGRNDGLAKVDIVFSLSFQSLAEINGGSYELCNERLVDVYTSPSK